MKSLNFSFTRLHTLFFYIFLLTFPFNIRKVFLSGYSYFTGHFVEDATYFLNLSDIFLMLAVVFAVLFIIQNKLQNDFTSFVRKYRYFFYILTALIIWSFLGVFYAKDKNLVLFGAAKIFEFSLLFFYLIYFLRDGKKLFTSLNLIAISGLIQSIIAIIQYLIQKSIGLKILGESIISKDLAGVAKILVDGEKIVRPYGTFGHPNVLAGFLVFSLSASLFLYLLRNKKPVNPHTNIFGVGVNIFYLVFGALLLIMFFDHYLITNQQGQIIFWLVLGMMFTVSISPFRKGGLRGIFGDTLNPPSSLFQRGNLLSLFRDHASRWWILPFIIIQFITLILTYSRSAWLAFGFIIIGVTIFSFKNLVWKSWSKILLLFLIIIVLSFIFLPIKTRINNSLDSGNQAISDRVLSINTALKIIKAHPLLGVGNKNYVINIDAYETRQLEYWQYQPAHNGYILIISELGIIGLGIFAVFAVFVAAYNFIFRGKS